MSGVLTRLGRLRPLLQPRPQTRQDRVEAESLRGAQPAPFLHLYRTGNELLIRGIEPGPEPVQSEFAVRRKAFVGLAFDDPLKSDFLAQLPDHRRFERLAGFNLSSHETPPPRGTFQ